MTLRQLLFFQQVIEHGFNVTAAAQALYTSQSGVSKQLHGLAEELGLALFRNKGKRLVGLTPAGEQVAEIETRMLRDAEAIRALGLQARVGAGSRLGVVATRHTASENVRGAIMRFQRAHPQVSLRFSEQEPAVACSLVASGEMQIGIVPDWHVHDRHLLAMPFGYWRLVLVGPAEHPLLTRGVVGLNDLAAEPMASYECSSASRQHIDAVFAAAGHPSPVAIELSSSRDLLDYAASGAALAVVADAAFDSKHFPGLRSRALDHLIPGLTSSIIVQRHAAMTPAVEAFIALLTGGRETAPGVGVLSAAFN